MKRDSTIWSFKIDMTDPSTPLIERRFYVARVSSGVAVTNYFLLFVSQALREVFLCRPARALGLATVATRSHLARDAAGQAPFGRLTRSWNSPKVQTSRAEGPLSITVFVCVLCVSSSSITPCFNENLSTFQPTIFLHKRRPFLAIVLFMLVFVVMFVVPGASARTSEMISAIAELPCFTCCSVPPVMGRRLCVRLEQKYG